MSKKLLFAAIASILATGAYATSATVTSKDYVDNALETKQDTIETGLVSLGDDWIEDLPAVASYDTTSGLVGNKYGILDYNGSAEYVDDGWNNYTQDDETNHLIPTVGAVGREINGVLVVLGQKQDNLGGSSSKAGKVVTATATAGDVTYTAIDGTVTNASSNLVTSGAVYTAVNTKQAKKTCAGWLDGTTVADATHTDANCVLWNLPD